MSEFCAHKIKCRSLALQASIELSIFDSLEQAAELWPGLKAKLL